MPGLWSCNRSTTGPLAEIAGPADSVYVSFYSGLAGLSGAAVAGEKDAIDELRGWRQRMGGQLYRMSPYAVSAPRRPAGPAAADGSTSRGRAFAAELVAAGCG